MQDRTGAGAAPAAPAFVRRQIPVYELGGEEGLALLEAKADEWLAENWQHHLPALEERVGLRTMAPARRGTVA